VITTKTYTAAAGSPAAFSAVPASSVMGAISVTSAAATPMKAVHTDRVRTLGMTESDFGQVRRPRRQPL
jgi:hypothetical protein